MADRRSPRVSTGSAGSSGSQQGERFRKAVRKVILAKAFARKPKAKTKKQARSDVNTAMPWARGYYEKDDSIRALNATSSHASSDSSRPMRPHARLHPLGDSAPGPADGAGMPAFGRAAALPDVGGSGSSSRPGSGSGNRGGRGGGALEAKYAPTGTGTGTGTGAPSPRGRSASSKSPRGPGSKTRSFNDSAGVGGVSGAIKAIGADGLAADEMQNAAVPVMVVEESPAFQAQQNSLKHQLSERFLYWVDQRIAGGRGKSMLLLLVAMVQVLFGAAMLYTGERLDTGEDDFWNALWRSWTYIADPGTHAVEERWTGRALSFLITCGGVLFFASLVGFVVDSIRARARMLEKGKSRVVEAGHYLILGWTDKSFTLILELALAMESEGGGVIVILAEREKDELEQEIKEHFGEMSALGSRIVCRSGSAILLSELAKVSAAAARSVIVLAEPGDADKSDAKVLRTILSLVGMKTPLVGHVVAEMRDVDNEGLVSIVGRKRVETIVSHDLIGRLMIKCARQPGLARAYDTFLGFAGDEFYISGPDKWPQLVGLKFGDLLLRFPAAVPVGLKRSGEVVLNPDPEEVLRGDDEVLFLAEDDDTYEPQEVDDTPVLLTPPPEYTEPERTPERMLMSGWRRDVDDIICLLDSLVMPGSELHMLCEVEVAERVRRLEAGGLMLEDLTNLKLVHHVGNPSFRRHLEELPLETFDSVLIISDASLEGDAMHSDSACLASLLLTRHIQELRYMELEQAEAALESAAAENGGHSLNSSAENVPANSLQVGSSAGGGTASRLASGGAASASGRPVGPGWEITRVPSGKALDIGEDGSMATPAGTSFSIPPVTRGSRHTLPRLHSGDSSGRGDMASPSDDDGKRASVSSLASNVSETEALLRLARATVASSPELAGDAARAGASSPTGEVGSAAAAAAAAASPGNPLAPRRSTQHVLEGADPLGYSQGLSIQPDVKGKAHAKPSNNRQCVMCCELLDARTRGVVEENSSVAILSDFVLSNNIVSRVLAMVAERREVKALLMELLGPAGQDVGVEPISKYVRVAEGEAASFWDISLRARKFREVVLGYRRVDAPGITTNPQNKAEKLLWHDEDTVIVMALSDLEASADNGSSAASKRARSRGMSLASRGTRTPVQSKPGSRRNSGAADVGGPGMRTINRRRGSITTADTDWVADRVMRRASVASRRSSRASHASHVSHPRSTGGSGVHAADRADDGGSVGASVSDRDRERSGGGGGGGGGGARARASGGGGSADRPRGYAPRTDSASGMSLHSESSERAVASGAGTPLTPDINSGSRALFAPSEASGLSLGPVVASRLSSGGGGGDGGGESTPLSGVPARVVSDLTPLSMPGLGSTASASRIVPLMDSSPAVTTGTGAGSVGVGASPAAVRGARFGGHGASVSPIDGGTPGTPGT